MIEVENEKKKQIKGFKKVKTHFFKSFNKIVRKISNVTYRILSFIFYSYICQNEKLGYLKEKDLNNFYFFDGSEQNNPIEYIEYILIETLKILKEELLKRKNSKHSMFLKYDYSKNI